MLTGLITPSEGYAKAYDKDLFNNMDEVRQFMGVCPQHDVLFDLLTPEEHLDVFCDFKGVSKEQKEIEITKIMADIELTAVKD
jgi:ATP-binding cassette subfamily A (ABC1) protein 3